MDFHPGTGVRTGKDKVTLLAPRPTGEPLIVLVAIRTHLHHKQSSGKKFLMLKGDVSLQDATFGSLVDVRGGAKNPISAGDRQLLGFFFGGSGEYGNVF
jgi:hypothetical protein